MGVLSLLVVFPAAAFLMVLAFMYAAYCRRKRLPAIAAALWLAYGVYESLMYARVFCSGECNIRVDLLLLYPLLLLVTVVGIVSASRGK